MEAGHDDDRVAENVKEERIRKAPHEGATGFAMQNRKRLGPVENRLESSEDLSQKFLAESRPFPFVPGEAALDVSRGRRPKYMRLHRGRDRI